MKGTCFVAVLLLILGVPWVAGAGELHAITIGFSSNKPPYVFESEARGLEVDIVLGAARRGGLEVQPYFAPLERLHLLLAARKIDAIATTNSRSDVHALYSAPYITYHNYAVALAARNLKIAAIADLRPYSVSAFQRARELLGSEFHAMATANPRYREEGSQVVRNLLLFSGRVDVIVGDKRIIDYFTRHPGVHVYTGQDLAWFDIFPPTDYQVGFADAALRDAFDRGLEAFKADGSYAAVERRYGAE